MVRKVAVLGWYNHNNFGDDLILEGLRTLFKNWQVLPMSSTNFDINQINTCDLFVLGGGELIPEWLHLRQLPRYVRGITNKLLGNGSFLHKINVPKIVLGCGVETEKLSKKDVSELEQFDYIGLRDNKSVETLKAYKHLQHKTHLFHDCSFAINLSKKHVNANKNLAVAVPTERQNILDTHWFKQKLEPYNKAVFMAFGKEDNNDYKTCKKLTNYMNMSETISYDKLNLQNVSECMLYADKIFSCRLHGMILAHILNKPYECYPYHSKVSKVYETIKHLSFKTIRRRQQKEMDRLLNLLA